MNCRSCGHENPEQAKFCLECGQAFALRCGNCTTELPAAAKFCLECGTPTASGADERAPADYTPKHLADKILQSKSVLEGERKRVTVLFADVKGSMELAEQLDPEEWHRILDRFFRILTDGVHRFEGTINQYTGDGVMALFGAPIAHEDHAQRSCYAALHLRDELRSLRDELRLSRGIDFQVRIGINSGEVVVGRIGDDLRMDYTAQGHTVGLAARMEQVAAANTICLSEATQSLVSGYFDLRDLGTSSVKGAREPVRVFELEGIGPAQTRFEISRARGLTRFVGRDDDLGTLETALSHAREGNGQVVGIVAEAGVGKSRLCFEFVERCRAQGLRVLQGRAAAHGKNVPLLSILQVFRAYFGITELDDDRLIREKIAGRMLLFDEEYRKVLPLLFDFFGVPDPDNPAPRIEGDARQRQLFGVLRRLAQRDSTGGSIVTVIEDLHWLDGASEAWLAEWVDAIAGSPNLLLVNFRPEYHAEWMQKSWYHQLPLAPLGPEATRELVNHLLGDDPSVADLAAEIHARTGGNPFFTEEVVRSLSESGHLQGAKGSYRLVTPIERLDVPPEVQSVLAARIDRLAEREKRLLQTASVIGDDFAEPVLAAVLKLTSAELADGLGNLKSGEFIYELSLFPTAEYAFKHPLTRQVAYESRLSEPRAKIHAMVARVVEEQSEDKLDQQAGVLADHWERAGEPLNAARWHARAGAWVGLNHPSEALNHLRRVRELLVGVPESAEAQQLGLQARGHLLFQGWRVGAEHEEVRALIAEGRALAEQLDDPGAHVGFLMQGVMALRSSGLVGEAREMGAELARLTEASEQPALKGMGIVMSGFEALSLGEGIEEVPGDCDRFLALADPSDPAVPMLPGPSMALILKGTALTYLGRLDGAATALGRAVVETRAADQLPALATAHGAMVTLAERSGDREAALLNGLRAVELEEEVGSPAGLLMAYTSLGKAWRLNGDAAQATAALDRAISLAREHGVGMSGGLVSFPSALWNLAQVGLAVGDARAARSAVDEAIALVHRFGARLDELPAQLVLARTMLHSSQEKRAEIDVALERAALLIRETSATAFEPDLHEIRAEAARRFGDPATCNRELREAHRLYTEMGALGHSERVAMELEQR